MKGAIAAFLLIGTVAMPVPTGASDRFESAGQPKIIGGSEASVRDWPWQAVLRLNEASTKTASYFCGGTVIAAHWVLTAGHCLASLQEKQSFSRSFLDAANRWHKGSL